MHVVLRAGCGILNVLTGPASDGRKPPRRSAAMSDTMLMFFVVLALVIAFALILNVRGRQM